MDKKTEARLFAVASIGFAVAGIGCLYLCIYKGQKQFLAPALICAIFGNVFNMLRKRNSEK